MCFFEKLKLKPFEDGCYWYNHEHFDKDNSIWVIDKKAILKALRKEIEINYLTFCPVSSETKMLEVINELPEKINLTGNAYWNIVYEKKFSGDKIIDVPVSIEHVIPNDESEINHLDNIENLFLRKEKLN